MVGPLYPYSLNQRHPEVTYSHSILNRQFNPKLELMSEGKFNLYHNTLITCGVEILERPNKWKLILIGEKTTLQGFEYRTSKVTHLPKSSIDQKGL